MRRSFASLALVLWVAGFGPSASDRTGEPVVAPGGPVELLVADYFTRDPSERTDLVVAGDWEHRVSHRLSPPAWPGDRPGALLARYDASAPAALFGLALDEPLDESDCFTAAAIVVIEPDGFSADPDGFFQISWGLWNRGATGLDRTGSFDSFAGDTFESLGFDYFPNVSPFFGGPYLSPAIFGEADPTSPDFPFQGAFANASFAFNVEVDLPLGEPLLMVIEHRPDVDAAVFTVHRIVGPRSSVPIPAAVTTVPLGGLRLRRYLFDAVGLMLWNDGFGGAEPSVLANVGVHGLIVARGPLSSVDAILRLPPVGR